MTTKNLIPALACAALLVPAATANAAITAPIYLGDPTAGLQTPLAERACSFQYLDTGPATVGSAVRDDDSVDVTFRSLPRTRLFVALSFVVPGPSGTCALFLEAHRDVTTDSLGRGHATFPTGASGSRQVLIGPHSGAGLFMGTPLIGSPS